MQDIVCAKRGVSPDSWPPSCQTASEDGAGMGKCSERDASLE